LFEIDKKDAPGSGVLLFASTQKAVRALEGAPNKIKGLAFIADPFIFAQFEEMLETVPISPSRLR
jgi:hypothetical protein